MTLAHPQPSVMQIIELANLHQIIPLAHHGELPTVRKTT